MENELLFDLAYFRPDTVNSALELLFKARQEGEDSFIWTPHESPLIRKMIELFTTRGLMRLESVQKALLRWQNKTDADTMPPPSPMTDAMAQSMVNNMARWTAEERELVRIYLDALPPSMWGLNDHMLSVELVVQTYLPHDELVTEAQWLATKATMMGKVERNWTKKQAPTLAEADKLLAGMPGSPEQAAFFPLSPKEKTTLEFANFRAVENVVSLRENVRHKMRATVAKHVEKKLNGDTSGSSLQSELFDTFGELNRDWRRIAITEAGESQLQGMIAGTKPGDKVKRVEQYASACPFCKKIHGVIATVVTADHPNKDPDTMIWPGKNNIGRSASPRKRVGNVLVKRTADELFWLPAGLAHPHCRGRWVPVVTVDEAADPAFAAIVAEFLANT
ncbi:hypothetical protein EU642_21985 [Salmonella enterica]|nr:hypothetical protein [Salmonella enterica]EAO0118524.1 hypothetical protein [Salmonella enterica]EAO3601628.1 hypothetical protein [Salmonella enterica]EAR6391522.1 hypothetical protein [Salmonella enterica]EAV1285286.1 hypothetical protein [Salmonella enterica]